MRSTLLALLALCMLTACDSTRSLRDLKLATPNADPYYAALAEGYGAYSAELMQSYAWWTSKYFADKGLLAAYGQSVEPEDPALWNLPADLSTEFEQARAHLTAAIGEHAAHDPALAATAMVAYDRWVEIQNNNWDLPGIAAAREAFYEALEQLAAAAPKPEPALKPGKKTHGGATGKAQRLLQSVVETTSAILYFPMDGSGLSASARDALNEMIAYIKQAGPVSISINGHADRVGTDQYNLTLSQQRAQYVMKALRDAGVPESRIQYFAFGESDPKVPTPDNIPEAHNRRVEIYLE